MRQVPESKMTEVRDQMSELTIKESQMAERHGLHARARPKCNKVERERREKSEGLSMSEILLFSGKVAL